ncbi:MAG TPA: type II toxin-antitoxin system HicA family toxin [Blastocatellia bacterium]|nr:type II toxin-antitoxin system HicA family toxin [Blastocatellia bacterium]
MKRSVLISHLRRHGCSLRRHGGKHDIWENHDQTKTSAVPRHTEIKDRMAAKICEDPGIPPV